MRQLNNASQPAQPADEVYVLHDWVVAEAAQPLVRLSPHKDGRVTVDSALPSEAQQVIARGDQRLMRSPTETHAETAANDIGVPERLLYGEQRVGRETHVSVQKQQHVTRRPHCPCVKLRAASTPAGHDGRVRARQIHCAVSAAAVGDDHLVRRQPVETAQRLLDGAGFVQRGDYNRAAHYAHRVAHQRPIGDNSRVARKEYSLETPGGPETSVRAGIEPKPWGLPAVLLALALPFLLWSSSLALSIADDTELDLSEGEIVANLVIVIILDVVLIGLAAGLSVWRYRLGWGTLGLRRFAGNFWWWPLAAAAAAHVSIIVYSLVMSSVGADAAVPKQEDLDELFKSRTVLPLAGVATVIMAPLAEEIFFRGFVFAGLIRPFGVLGAMAASGLMFGAFHITSMETVGLVLPFGLIGMLFAWLYFRTRSIWISIGTHFLFNLVSFIALATLSGNGSG